METQILCLDLVVDEESTITRRNRLMSGKVIGKNPLPKSLLCNILKNIWKVEVGSKTYIQGLLLSSWTLRISY